MPAESVIEMLRRLEAEDSIWPVKVQRDDLRLLLAVAEAADAEVAAVDAFENAEIDENDVAPVELQLAAIRARYARIEAVRALRAGGSDV